MTQFVLKVIKSEGKITKTLGFVGNKEGKSWPVVKYVNQAQKWSNGILAEGAASQYFEYLRTKYPNCGLADSIKLEHVQV